MNVNKNQTFSDSRLDWKQKYSTKSILEKSITTVDGKWVENISLRRVNGTFNEEYYKWEFIYSLIASKLFSREHIGTEIYFPKGNIKSSPIKIDAVIFRDLSWLSDYQLYRNNKDTSALERLRENAVVMIEFKDDNDKKMEEVFSSQIKATIKESDSLFSLGVYYNQGRLYLFKKINGEITRLDNSKNIKSSRTLEKYQLELTDPYYFIPSLEDIEKKISGIDIKKEDLTVEDLDVIDKISDENLSNSLNLILRELTANSLFNQNGYMLLIQLLALKIYEEQNSDQFGEKLRFYILPSEYIENSDIADDEVQNFIKRISNVYNSAKLQYVNILPNAGIDFTDINIVKVSQVIVREFQRYAFIRSKRGDLYQLVFYNFATTFKKANKGQFLTPIPIINFIVSLMNPRRNETVCDPCCGIADFLSVSYVNSNFKLKDDNLFGVDNDKDMTILARLNMLLNGDGNANIFYADSGGSLNHKINTRKELVELNPKYHHSGNWDNWVDGTEILKYDVILTNPPFGKGQNLSISDKKDTNHFAKFYETYDRYINTNPKEGIDLGVLFLENTVRLTKDGGRFAIILSNSIASNKSFEFVREWLLSKVRIVALFDLPPNVFAETGANTTIIVGYKPKEGDKALQKLISDDYKVFTSEIDNVGYVKKTVKRNVVFEDSFKLDNNTFETVIDSKTGSNLLNEDFSSILDEFKDWCLFQEDELKNIFLEK